MAQAREYIVYIVGQVSKTKTPIGVLRGDFKKSTESLLSAADGQYLDVNEIANANKDAAKQAIKDAYEVLQDPNQTELIISEKTTVPFSSEIGFTYFIGPSSRIRVRGSLRKTENGITETKNGLHTVYLDGSVRLFALIGTVHVFLLTGTVTVDIDCRLSNVVKPMAALVGDSTSSESVVSLRSMHKRAAESYKRRTSQLAIYKLGGKSNEKAHADLSQLVFVGFCLGKVCRQEIGRDAHRFPLLPTPESPITGQSTVFVLANPLDDKIKKDISSLEAPGKTCAILGSVQSRMVLFGTSGSGIMLDGYWCVTVLTKKVQLVKGPGSQETLELATNGQIVIKMCRGNMHCLLDSECTFVVADTDAEFTVERHQAFDEGKGTALEDVGAVPI